MSAGHYEPPRAELLPTVAPPRGDELAGLGQRFGTFPARTLGKLVVATRVIAATGGAPTFAQILGRSLSRFVPFEPFSFLGEQPIGWHDEWSRTRVVRTRGPRRTLPSKPPAG